MSAFTYSYAFFLIKWLTQMFVDWNSFDKGEINYSPTKPKNVR